MTLLDFRPTRRMVVAAAAVLVIVAAQGILYLYSARREQPAPDPAWAMPHLIKPEPPGRPDGWLSALLAPSEPAPRTVLCRDLPIPDVHWATRDEYAPAFVHVPAPGSVPIGGSVCVRVVVPAMPSSASMVHVPPPGQPWDSVMLDLVGKTTNISVPVRLQLVADIRNTQRGSTHIYEADVVLRDADAFVPRGYIEYRAAEWNSEDEAPVVPYKPEDIFIDGALQVVAEDRDGTSPYSLSRHADLPLCTDPGAEGRWVRAEAVPFSLAAIPPADNHDMVWLPYACRLRRISYPDAASCMAERHPLMHWYGDSNVRRALKKITTAGVWCSQPDELPTRRCLCEDYSEPFTKFNVNARQQTIDLTREGGQQLEATPGNYTAVPENTARFYVHKWEGLTYRNSPPWDVAFKAGITKTFGAPSVAVISLVNWDSAFSTRASFAAQMERLVAFMAAEYTPRTTFVIRTGQYYCCRHDNTPSPRTRNFSRLRNAYFNDYVLQAFRERFGGTNRVLLWDVAGLAEHLPFATRKEAADCPANHARAEVVDIENQLLFNALCNDPEPEAATKTTATKSAAATL
ncbi:hypothetical protein H4R18_001162 [Coemansia javaensis]|uniref:Uncharacterized protein n=1 Tax=Coemansia javaensis TaxID=2761396 RepID=A0A9W8HKJ3_9FUNG|nr:hypothetical protein H4R18_001162 [Coemansia javaensis]